MAAGLLLLQLLWLLLLPSSSSSSAQYLTTMPGCQEMCGNVEIPYPFGILGNEIDCYKEWGFAIRCNYTSNKTILAINGLEVLKISLSGTIVIRNEIAAVIRNGSTTLDFTGTPYIPPLLPSVTLDWVIGNGKCLEAMNSNNYACGSNADCRQRYNITLSASQGYNCMCRNGYEGSPYLPDGCQDIDECSMEFPPCPRAACTNTVGSYTCSSGSNKKYLALGLIIVIIGVLLLVVFGIWLVQSLKKRKQIKLKKKFFKENGGLLLQQKIHSRDGSVEQTKIFLAEELERATDNYNKNRILGQGGFGTVYKGMLADGQIIAVKKSKTKAEGQIEQFINELAILSQINHRNVVKILGCCLETKVPLLVYEFISNGTLFHHIHELGHESSMSWENRLRIAAEVAGALAYMHSTASIPIFHRDIKCTNILLDNQCIAKVSDFGISRTVPCDQTHLTTAVQGTFGYLDPEYYYTSQYTDKSDVYSFGIVLVELLTGEKPISFERSEEFRSLAKYFISSMAENRLVQILEDRVAEEEWKEQVLAVAEVAKACLRQNGEKRPTMKEVVTELEGLRMSQRRPWLEENK